MGVKNQNVNRERTDLPRMANLLLYPQAGLYDGAILLTITCNLLLHVGRILILVIGTYGKSFTVFIRSDIRKPTAKKPVCSPLFQSRCESADRQTDYGPRAGY